MTDKIIRKGYSAGEKYNMLTFVRKAPVKSRVALWEFLCDCGNTTVMRADNVKSGNTKHCGCLSPQPYNEGDRFGLWTLLEKTSGGSGNTKIIWVCRCDCGTVRKVQQSNLRNGHSKSCGCLFTHGHTRGGKPTPEFVSWSSMLNRCYNSNDDKYTRYGAKGITVCPEWHNFQIFIRDMGPKPTPKHTIDRINNDLGYSKENCRWATAKEQADNRRNTIVVEYEGKIYLSAATAAKAVGANKNSLAKAIREGRSESAGRSFIYHGRVGDVDPEILERAA